MPSETAIRPRLIIGVVASGDLTHTEGAVGDALQHRAVAVSDGVDIAQRIRVQVTQFIRLLNVVLQGAHLHRHFCTVDVNCVMAGYHSSK